MKSNLKYNKVLQSII